MRHRDSRRLTDEIRRITRAQSAARPVQGEGDPAEPRLARGSRPYGWTGLFAVVVLVVGGWLLMRRMAADAKLQDCVMSGRKNCAPVDQP
jgi:hypothetical protein